MDPTPLDIVTLVIAVVGALTGVGSLVFTVAAHRATGVRAKIDLRLGVLSHGGWVSFDPRSSNVPGAVSETGLRAGPAVAGICVRNTGRLPFIVERVVVQTDAASYQPASYPASPTLPRPIAVSASATWFVPAEDVLALVESSGRLWATVELGNGQAVSSRKAKSDDAMRGLASFLGSPS